MLESSQAVTFLPSEDLERSERFFREVLGLRVVSRSDFACVIACAGSSLRITKVDGLRPQPFTVLGWLVEDLTSVIGRLREAGTAMAHFEGLDQDELGVWTTPTGDRVAWFHDPDGNVLSVTQLATG
jgi:catechol 2,3-dioxygenase-like lactoylglutathione lyase family enzyme